MNVHMFTCSHVKLKLNTFGKFFQHVGCCCHVLQSNQPTSLLTAAHHLPPLPPLPAVPFPSRYTNSWVEVYMTKATQQLYCNSDGCETVPVDWNNSTEMFQTSSHWASEDELTWNLEDVSFGLYRGYPKWDPFGGDQTMQMYGEFEGFPENNSA